MGKDRDRRGKLQGSGHRAVPRRDSGREVTEGYGDREVPGKRGGGCRKELGADGGGLGWAGDNKF